MQVPRDPEDAGDRERDDLDADPTPRCDVYSPRESKKRLRHRLELFSKRLIIMKLWRVKTVQRCAF